MLRSATLVTIVGLGLSGCGSAPAPRATAVRRAVSARAPARVPAARNRRRAMPGLPRRTHLRAVDVPILTYHRVHSYATEHKPSSPDLTVEPHVFAAEMSALVHGGYHTISQRQLYAAMFSGGRLPPRPVLITADDGYRDDATVMLPILRRRHLTATFYIVTHRIGMPGFVTRADLRRLQSAGMDLGAHTQTHADLPELPPARARQEIAGSARDLARVLGRQTPWFAYPYGASNPAVTEDVRQAGFALATTTRGGVRESPDAPLELPRLHIGRQVTPAGLLGELRGLHE